MMHKKKIELMFSRPNLKGFLWLGLFVLQSSTLDADQSSGCTARESVTTKVGDVVKLPCNYKIKPGSLKTYLIYWQHKNCTNSKDYSLAVVVAYVDGKENISLKDPRYVNRSEMDEQNLTLSLFSVKVSDIGLYQCVIIEDYDLKHTYNIKLSVTADFSAPVIDWSPNSCGQTSLKVTCSSHGGYPEEPKMYGSVNNESVNWKYHIITDDKTQLMNITGILQINVTEDIFVTCSVGYPGFQRSTTEYLSRAQFICPLEQPPSHGVIIAGSVVLAFVVIIVLVILFRGCTCQRPRSYDYSSSSQPVATNEISLQFNGTSEAVIGKQVL